MPDADQKSAESRPSLLLAPGGAVLGLFFALFGTLVVEAVGQAFGSPSKNPTPAVNLLANAVLDLGFVAAVAFIAINNNGFGSFKRQGTARMDLRFFGYVRVRFWIAAVAVVVGFVLYLGIGAGYAALLNLHGQDKLPASFGVTRSTVAAVAATAMVCVVAPICEELFFRGFLFGVLRQMRVRVGGRDLGPWLAAVIVAILFGLAHAGSALGEDLVPLGMLGFILCLIRWWTDSLYPGMALHSINNAAAIGLVEFHLGLWTVLIAAGSLVVIGLITGPLSRPRQVGVASGVGLSQAR